MRFCVHYIGLQCKLYIDILYVTRCKDVGFPVLQPLCFFQLHSLWREIGVGHCGEK
jgi:hypothetical protein